MTKRVIITGASSGIGRETALALAEHPVELVLAARRSSLLKELAKECAARGARVEAVTCDVTSHTDRQQLVLEAQKMGSGVMPVLVNSAGVAEFGDYASMPAGSVQHQIEANLLAPMLMSQDVLPWMLHVGHGHIVNVLSIAAEHPFPGSAAYCAAKAGLLMFGKSLNAEYRRKGVYVTALLPGSTDTPLWEGKSWMPPREDMLTSRIVAETIRDLVLLPSDRAVDQVTLMPPKGVL